MSTKPYRVVVIEPDSTQWPMIRSAFAKYASSIEIQVVSNLAEARSQIDGSPSPLVFSALSPAQLCGKDSDGTLNSPGETNISPHQFADFCHALRGSLGIILNAVFLMKRSTPEDHALRENYLEMIKEEVSTMKQLIIDLHEKGEEG